MLRTFSSAWETSRFQQRKKSAAAQLATCAWSLPPHHSMKSAGHQALPSIDQRHDICRGTHRDYIEGAIVFSSLVQIKYRGSAVPHAAELIRKEESATYRNVAASWMIHKFYGVPQEHAVIMQHLLFVAHVGSRSDHSPHVPKQGTHYLTSG